MNGEKRQKRGAIAWRGVVPIVLVIASSFSTANISQVSGQALPIGLGVSLGIGLGSRLFNAANNRHSSSGSSSFFSSGSGSRRSKNQAIVLYNKSIKLFNDHEYDQAAPLLAEAIEINPRYGNAHALLGICKGKLGQYSDAMQQFSLAQNYGYDYKTMLYEEGVCAVRLQDYKTAEDSFRQFMAKAHDESQEETAKRGLEIVEHDFVSPSDDNYVTDASTGGQRRWNLDQMPLRVFIDADPNLKGYHPEFVTLLQQSFKDWQDGTNDKLKFEFTDDRAKANIVCSWTDNQADFGDSKELGLTRTTVREGVIIDANIKLFTLVGFAGTDPTEIFPQAKCVALHEIGHALGLQHSTSTFDTMYFQAPPKGLEFKLTKRDINTAKAFYEQTSVSANPTIDHNLVSQASNK